MKIQNKYKFIIISLVLVLVSCTAPTKQVRSFGAATSSIATDAQKCYTFLDESIKKRQLYVAALYPERPVTSKTFEGILNEKERLIVRTALLKHLGDYADALKTLTEKDFKTDIDSSSNELADALSGLKTTYEKINNVKLAITKDQIFILSTLIDTVGSAYVEYKRKKVLKTIVTKVDPAIQQVARILKTEFSNIGPVVERSLDHIETLLEKAYNQNSVSLPYEKRIEILTYIQAAHDNAKNSRKLYTTIGDAANKMGKTHSTLAAALKQNKLTTPELIADVRELVAWAKSIREFYSTLK